LVLTTTVYGTFAAAAAPSGGGASVSSPGSASSGSLSSVADGPGSGLTQRITGLAPGDTVLRYVDVVAGGSLGSDGVRLHISAAPASTLTVDGVTSRGLRAQVVLCASGPWQPATGTCRSRTVELLPSTPLAALTAPRALPTGRVAPGRVLHLRLILQLPDQDETTMQGVLPAGTVHGRQALVTWTFTTRRPT